jgi:hypothetical protein
MTPAGASTNAAGVWTEEERRTRTQDGEAVARSWVMTR